MQTKTKTAIVWNEATFAKAVASIKNRGAMLDRDIQAAGLAALQQVGNGNTNWLNSLAAAMPKGARMQALKQWALAHAPCVENPNAKEAKAGKLFLYDKTKRLDLAEASAKPWFSFTLKADREAPAFDAQKAVEDTLKRIKAKASLTASQQADLERLTAEIKAVLARPLTEDEAAPL